MKRFLLCLILAAVHCHGGYAREKVFFNNNGHKVVIQDNGLFGFHRTVIVNNGLHGFNGFNNFNTFQFQHGFVPINSFDFSLPINSCTTTSTLGIFNY